MICVFVFFSCQHCLAWWVWSMTYLIFSRASCPKGKGGILHSTFYREPVKEILRTMFTEIITTGISRTQPGISLRHVCCKTVWGLLLEQWRAFQMFANGFGFDICLHLHICLDFCCNENFTAMLARNQKKIATSPESRQFGARHTGAKNDMKQKNIVHKVTKIGQSISQYFLQLQIATIGSH